MSAGAHPNKQFQIAKRVMLRALEKGGRHGLRYKEKEWINYIADLLPVLGIGGRETVMEEDTYSHGGVKKSGRLATEVGKTN